jgi:hypothetical protein
LLQTIHLLTFRYPDLHRWHNRLGLRLPLPPTRLQWPILHPLARRVILLRLRRGRHVVPVLHFPPGGNFNSSSSRYLIPDRIILSRGMATDQLVCHQSIRSIRQPK